MGEDFGIFVPIIIFAITSILAAVGSSAARKRQAEAKQADQTHRIARTKPETASRPTRPENKAFNTYKVDTSRIAKPTINIEEDDKKSGHAMGEAEPIDPIVGSLGEVKTEGCFEHEAFRFISVDTNEGDGKTVYDYDKIAAAIVFGSVFSEPVGSKETKF
ncbi:MAG TPA: hypothetical protein PK675_03035 [Clostridia bacterium]|nr:hypothetical protein [Clostridia bacterium]